jgi:ferrochelatase
MKEDHPDIKFGKTGVLLINLGTPDSTSWWDIRKYLKEFLSDRRVIEVNPLLWQIILNLFILTFRPSKTAHAYKKIWRKESNESPLLFFTRNQANKLKTIIGNEKIIVNFAMRYGNPSIKSQLDMLKKKNS